MLLFPPCLFAPKESRVNTGGEKGEKGNKDNRNKNVLCRYSQDRGSQEYETKD